MPLGSALISKVARHATGLALFGTQGIPPFSLFKMSESVRLSQVCTVNVVEVVNIQVLCCWLSASCSIANRIRTHRQCRVPVCSSARHDSRAHHYRGPTHRHHQTMSSQNTAQAPASFRKSATCCSTPPVPVDDVLLRLPAVRWLCVPCCCLSALALCFAPCTTCPLRCGRSPSTPSPWPRGPCKCCKRDASRQFVWSRNGRIIVHSSQKQNNFLGNRRPLTTKPPANYVLLTPSISSSHT